MSRNVTVLERNRYLLRSRDGEDARVVLVRLTPKGNRALDTLCCDERNILKDVYQRLPAAERPKVLKALEQLRTCLEEADVAGAPCCPPGAVQKRTS
jgi:DNA-binding MarR family transcriptional regulator